MEIFLILSYVHTRSLDVYGMRLSSVLCFSLSGKVLAVALLILFILLGIGKERVYKLNSSSSLLRIANFYVDHFI